MGDILEKIYGDGFAAKLAEFEKRLEEIEADNIDWFKSQPPRFDREEHDLLVHHYLLNWNSSGRIIFKINDDSNLPQPIKDKCIDAFYGVFGA